MRALAENEKRDLFLGANKRLGVVLDFEVVAQRCKSAVEAQLSEMIFAVDTGVPTFSTIWSGNPNLQQFEFYVRKAIRQVENVIEVLTFEAEIVGNTTEYRATISTTYGEGIVSGSL